MSDLIRDDFDFASRVLVFLRCYVDIKRGVTQGFVKRGQGFMVSKNVAHSVEIPCALWQLKWLILRKCALITAVKNKNFADLIVKMKAKVLAIKQRVVIAKLKTVHGETYLGSPMVYDVYSIHNSDDPECSKILLVVSLVNFGRCC